MMQFVELAERRSRAFAKFLADALRQSAPRVMLFRLQPQTVTHIRGGEA